MSKYIPVIGLEIHVELKTKSKMFCQCDADYFGKAPNTNTCPVCLGLPGALPVPNKKAIEWAALIGRALGCQINEISKFDRKHYFYPDLPKGYQISQYDEPISINGNVKVSGKDKSFRITRVHLEEDTGKLSHQGGETLIDFNRSSVPLVEIVTEPDFDNSDDVKGFLEELQVIIRYLGVSDADMEKGTMRLEPNISLKLKDAKELPPYKVEVKNINSFRFVKQAIEYELKRQEDILEKGEIPLQETRGFDEKKATTYSQRAKEDAHDYRYFPEPDIPPLKFDKDSQDSINRQLPELPYDKVERYIRDFKLKPQDAFILTRDIKIMRFFELCLAQVSNKSPAEMAQKIANSIVNKRIPVTLSPKEFVEKVIVQSAPKQTDEGLLTKTIESVLKNNEKVVGDYKAGKENAIMFLVGQVMREMKGQADAQTVKKALEYALK